MPLTQKQIEHLAKLARLQPSELQAIIDGEQESEVEFPAVQSFTDDEIQTRINNTIKESVSRYAQKELDGVHIGGNTVDEIINTLGKTVYDDSKVAAMEMGIKSWKEENNLDFEGKDLDSVVNHIRSQKADTGELEGTINGLRQNLTAKEKEISDLKSRYEGRLSEIQTRQDVLGQIPDNLVDTIKKDQVLQLFLSTHEIERGDGGVMVKRNGEVVKDAQLLNPKPLNQIINEFVEENGWIAKDRTGRGGKDHKTQTVTGVEHITDADTFYSYLEQKGIHRSSIDAVDVLNKLPKETQEIITKI